MRKDARLSDVMKDTPMSEQIIGRMLTGQGSLPPKLEAFAETLRVYEPTRTAYISEMVRVRTRMLETRTSTVTSVYRVTFLLQL